MNDVVSDDASILTGYVSTNRARRPVWRSLAAVSFFRRRQQLGIPRSTTTSVYDYRYVLQYYVACGGARYSFESDYST